MKPVVSRDSAKLLVKVGQRVIYKFDRKIVGGTTEQRVGRAKEAVKVEGVEVEAEAVVTKVHKDGTLDLEVFSRPGAGAPYSLRSVANGSGEGQWRVAPVAGNTGTGATAG